MMKPYPEGPRTRVAAAGAGVSCREAARRFGIGAGSVARRARRTGRAAAKPMGGDRNSRLKDERDWLHAARHVHAGHGTIWRFLAKEKITVKKIARAAGRERPDVKPFDGSPRIKGI